MDTDTVCVELDKSVPAMSNETTEECRACLQQCDSQTAYCLFKSWITPWAVRGALIADDLSKFADVEIQENDKYSKVICPQCYCKLTDACTFMITVQMSDSIMRQRADNGVPTNDDLTWPQPILMNKSGEIDGQMEVEVKQEVLSEEDVASNVEQDWEPMMDIKIEPEEISGPVRPNLQLCGTNTIEDMANLNGCTDSNDIRYEQEEYLNDAMKEEPQSGEDATEAAPDLSLDCILCSKVFNSVSGLKAHVISQHSYGAVKRKAESGSTPVTNNVTVQERHTCNTCDESFATSTDLMVHRATHSDHVCFVCDRKFSSFHQLTSHGARCQKKYVDRRQVARPSRPSRPQQLSNPVKNILEPQKGHQTQEELKLKLLNTLSLTETNIKTSHTVKLFKNIMRPNKQEVREDLKIKNKSESIVFAKKRKTEKDNSSDKNLPECIQVRKKSIPKVDIDREKRIEESDEKEPENNSTEPKNNEKEIQKLNNDFSISEEANTNTKEFFEIEPSEGLKFEIIMDNESDSEPDEPENPKSKSKNITSTSSETTSNDINKNHDELLQTKESTDENISLPSTAVSSLSNHNESVEQLPNKSSETVEQNLLSKDLNGTEKTEVENSTCNIKDKNDILVTTSSTDELSEMKVHLAINPLKDNVFDSEMDVDSVKSDSCEPKLVSIKNVQSDT